MAPETPSQPVLPLYEVEGWSGPRSVGGFTSLRDDGESGSLAEATGTVQHEDADFPQRHITVTVRAPFHGGPDERTLYEALARLTGDAGSGTASVTTLAIPVDGAPADFRVAHRGPYWAGICVLGDVEVTLTAAHVGVSDVRLVRMRSAPIAVHGRADRRRAPRPMRFPDDALAGGARADSPVVEGIRVNLIYENRTRLTGTYAGVPVDLEMASPASHGRATGTFAGDAVSASWEVADNSTSGPTVPASLTGTYADESVTLEGGFGLEPDFFFDAGSVNGAIGDSLPVHAQASGAEGGLNGKTVSVEGAIGGTDFSLFATIAGDLEAGLVVGSVGGRPLRLHAGYERMDRRVQRQSAALHITGYYEGPVALLALITGALLHFV